MPGTPFTFDPTALTAAQAAAGNAVRQGGSSATCCPRRRPATSRWPICWSSSKTGQGFFRALDYTLPWDVDAVEDAMPVEISALQEWIVGDRMLHDMLRGIDAAPRPNSSGGAAHCRRGSWAGAKPRRFAIAPPSLPRHPAGTPRRAARHDVAVDLGDGRSLTGTVTPVFGDRIVEVTYSKLDGRHLLQCWLRLLALAADEPSRAWTAMCIGDATRTPTG
ncbi:putative dNA helicase/exodeoxyribonuclease V [Mycobacterium xenopi 4042]|uniref:Putative dNA helicase/exodeoxyribonuclease V n=1 Tax=Mycobacterium xenopi 4042 TaxID=1299334 RepID=X7YHT0_MYCXE|nr:putative dNA helicase/exodeoxyribonuclease V [Mycobacterium xenopi 4042]